MRNFYLSGTSTNKHLRMNDDELESKFDNLVSTVSLGLGTQLLTRVPSVKNMVNLETLYLETNKITMIGPEDFKGAISLLVLTLAGNSIVSVATSAFENLLLFRVRPEDFNPTNADGTPYTDGSGIGIWRSAKLGAFGNTQDFAFTPIQISPNPVDCVWVGPFMSDFDCSACRLGYESDPSAVNTCVKPEFRPYKRWADSEDQAALELQDTAGATIQIDANTDTATLLTEHTYKIPPPLLTPIEKKFVGYEQPYSKIHYELDFSLGAEVDIGCGTEVVGDGSKDPKIPKDVYAHPASMYAASYQLGSGRANLNADPPDPG